MKPSLKSSFKLIALLLYVFVSNAQAQINTRTNSLTLVNGTGRLTLSYEGLDTALFSFPPGTSTSVGRGSVDGQTLSWQNGAWTPMTNLFNTGSSVSVFGNLSVEGHIIVNSGYFNGSGEGLTSLNASNISGGTLSDDRLSSNIPLKDASNVFTGATNSFLDIGAREITSDSIDNSGLISTVFVRSHMIDNISTINTYDLNSEIVLSNYIRALDFSSAAVSANTLYSESFTNQTDITNLGSITNWGSIINYGGILTDSITAEEFIGDGARLTGLNASNIISGTLTDTHLSNNVPLKNTSNVFTGATNSFLDIGAREITSDSIDNSGLISTLFVKSLEIDNLSTINTYDLYSESILSTYLRAVDFFSAAVGAGTLYSDNFTNQTDITNRGSIINDGGILTDSITAGEFIGDGARLTGLNADNIATGKLAINRISTTGATANQVLTYNGSDLAYADIPPPTSINASIITGTLNDTLLSSNIARLDQSNVFTQSNTFNGAVNTFTGTTHTFYGTTNIEYIGAPNANISTLTSGDITSGVVSAGLLFSDDGSGIEQLNASNITIGTLHDSILSSNVALLDAPTNTFTGTVAATAFTGNGANITAIDADNIATGLLSLSRIDTVGATAGQVLTYNGTNLAYTDLPALTSFDASLLHGTIHDTLLPSNIARLDQSNVFTQSNTFNGVTNTFFGAHHTFYGTANIEYIASPNANISTLASGDITSGVVTAGFLFSDDGSGIEQLNASNIMQGLLSLGRIDTTGATASQVLMYDGSELIYSDLPEGFTIPYTNTSAHVGPMFELVNTNSASGPAANFEIDNSVNSGTALTVATSGTGRAVYAQSVNSNAVLGISTSGIALEGQSNTSFGLIATSSTGKGAFVMSNSNIAIEGRSNDSIAAYFYAPNDIAVVAVSDTVIAVDGRSMTGIGVKGQSLNGYGGYFESSVNMAIRAHSPTGGIFATSEIGYGGRFESDSSTGVVGRSIKANGGQFYSERGYGVFGDSPFGIGGFFVSANAFALRALSLDSTAGLFESTAGIGVHAQSVHNYGGYFRSTNNAAIRAVGVNAPAISATGGDSHVIVATSTGVGIPVMGSATTNSGGYFSSEDLFGVQGTSTNGSGGQFTSMNGRGMEASSSAGVGATISSLSNDGVHAIALSGIAGKFLTSGPYAIHAYNAGGGAGSGAYIYSFNDTAVIGETIDGIGGVFSSVNNTGLLAKTATAAQYAARFIGNAGGAHGVQINAGLGGIGLQVDRGRLIGSYASIASGDQIPEDVMVVDIGDSGDGNPADALLPANAVNGQILIITCSDLDGFTIDGITHPAQTMRQWVYSGGQWYSQD